MGRPRRFRLPNVPQLVSQRGHNRLPCFIDGSDFELFRDTLRESAQRYECRIDALLLLPDSYWALLLPASEDGLSLALQRTGRIYVRHINHKYRRLGTLWAERYRACLVEPSPFWLAQVGQFLGSMPRRRGMVSEGQEWPWWESTLPDALAEATPAEQKTIERSLRQGLALGSEAFLTSMTQLSGQTVKPGRRGRPPAGAGSGR